MAKKGFKYKERDPEKLKEHAEQTGGNFDSIYNKQVDRFTPGQGENEIRILPPVWNDAEHYGYEVWTHNRMGADESSYVCPKKMLDKDCPMCDAAVEIKSEDEELAKKWVAKKSFICYVIDRNEKKPQPKLYQMSWTMDRDIAVLARNKKTGKALHVDHPDEGYDVSFTRKGTGKTTKYFGHMISRESSPIDESSRKQDEILETIEADPIPDLIKIYDPEYLEKVLKGKKAASDDDEDEKPKKKRRRDDDEDEDEAPKKKKRRDDDDDDDDDDDRPKKKKKPVDDDDEEEDSPKKKKKPADDEDEQEDEEEDERPRKRRRDDDEDEDEEDEKPAKKKKKSVDDDEDEEEDTPRKKRKPVEEDEDEEDEKPKKKSSRGTRDEDDEEEDERPKKKKKPVDDDDDEEEDDRVKKRR